MTTSRDSNALHRIVIVGGGAGGLELATRLGDSVGRRRQAQGGVGAQVVEVLSAVEQVDVE
jgi:NADH dehydrogenase FAD-containing subunit